MPANEQAAAFTHLSKEGIRQHYIWPGQWMFRGPEAVRSSRELLSRKCCLYKILISPRNAKWRSLLCPDHWCSLRSGRGTVCHVERQEAQTVPGCTLSMGRYLLFHTSTCLLLEKSVARITGETQRRCSGEEEMPQPFLTCPLYSVNNA